MILFRFAVAMLVKFIKKSLIRFNIAAELLARIGRWINLFKRFIHLSKSEKEKLHFISIVFLKVEDILHV